MSALPKLTLFEQGWQGFYQGIAPYIDAPQEWIAGWKAAQECELDEWRREKGLK